MWGGTASPRPTYLTFATMGSPANLPLVVCWRWLTVLALALVQGRWRVLVRSWLAPLRSSLTKISPLHQLTALPGNITVLSRVVIFPVAGYIDQ